MKVLRKKKECCRKSFKKKKFKHFNKGNHNHIDVFLKPAIPFEDGTLNTIVKILKQHKEHDVHDVVLPFFNIDKSRTYFPPCTPLNKLVEVIEKFKSDLETKWEKFDVLCCLMKKEERQASMKESIESNKVNGCCFNYKRCYTTKPMDFVSMDLKDESCIENETEKACYEVLLGIQFKEYIRKIKQAIDRLQSKEESHE